MATAMQPDAQSDGVTAAAGGPVAVICGGGSFPGAVAEAIKRRGRRPVMFAVRGWADPKAIEGYDHHWIAIGQAGRFFRLARAENCREALFIGTMLRPPLTHIRLDWQSLRLLPRVIHFFRGGDNRLLSGLASLFEDGGVKIIGVDEVAPEILVPEGSLARKTPSVGDRADIARALEVITALGPLDVGQAAIVANNHVLAVEAAEGTDNMLARVAALRGEGRVTTPLGVGVLVKAPKPGQDRRFDLPAIGLRTVENVARAGLAGLAVTAGSSIVAEPALVIAAADRANIFFLGVPEGAPA
jgi:UDP-2,3-diacylglucosamine hydrolase